MSAKVQNTIEKETLVKAPIEKVYAAISTPELFVKWWPDCSIPKGSLKPNEVTVVDFGPCGGLCGLFVVEARPHTYFSYRWVMGAANAQVAEGDPRRHPNTLVEYHLESVGGHTRVRVTETGFASLPPEQFAKCADHINEGWPIILGMLAASFEKN